VHGLFLYPREGIGTSGRDWCPPNIDARRGGVKPGTPAPKWLKVAQSGSNAVWRFSAVRPRVTQCGSMWLNVAPLTPPARGGGGLPSVTAHCPLSTVHCSPDSFPSTYTKALPPENVHEKISGPILEIHNRMRHRGLRRLGIFPIGAHFSRHSPLSAFPRSWPPGQAPGAASAADWGRVGSQTTWAWSALDTAAQGGHTCCAARAGKPGPSHGATSSEMADSGATSCPERRIPHLYRCGILPHCR